LGPHRPWSERQRPFVHLDLLSIALARWRPTGGDAPQEIVARVGILGGPGGLRSDQFNVESDGYPAADFVLKSEKIISIAVEPLCPQMSVCLSLDELGVDADMFVKSADASFKDVSDAQFTADPPLVDWLVLISERSIARDYEQSRDPR